jgi:drug/metabolite transporter (DMT)-like permease
MNKKVLAIFLAILAAGLYAINIPLSKLLLTQIEPTMMASYLYLGAGIGIGIVFLILKRIKKTQMRNLQKKICRMY